MKLQKNHIVIGGEWEDEQYWGKFQLGPELEGFWCECKFRAECLYDTVISVEFDSWESGYIDEENNECTLSESMDKLLESKVEQYIIDSLI